MAFPHFDPSPLSPRRTPEEETRDRDLGFGSVVSERSRRRLLNRDGSFNVVREGLGMLESAAPYHYLLTMSWLSFLGIMAALYLLINVVFGAAFLLIGPNALQGPGGQMLGGPMARAFFFSVQTFATIGYGQLAPAGFRANALVTFEALVGLMFQALATGLLFARFARPTASIMFSDKAIIAPYGSGTSLQFRIANRRRNQIIELEAQILFSRMEQRPEEPAPVRRYTALPLERNKVVFFPLSWTIVHPIDENSPLSGLTAQDLNRMKAELLVLLSGIDETFEQVVHTRSSYRSDEIVWNARFTNIFKQRTDGDLSIDISKLHNIDRL